MKVLVNGIQGQMGQAFLRVKNEDFTVVGGIDVNTSPCEVPVFCDSSEVDIDFDIVVDFSVPSAAMRALKMCVEKCKPIVICTTGIKDENLDAVKTAAKSIPVFMSGNMSLGVNLQIAIAKFVASTLGDDADIEIIEKHHNKKVDAPSGTALMIFNEINETLDDKKTPKYGRNPSDGRRSKDEIGIHSIRGGSIVGEHDICFLCEDEAITITHQAFSKRVFVVGAIRAAKFLLGRQAGLYSMKELVNE